jgi:predicted amidohydrolase YtcJ
LYPNTPVLLTRVDGHAAIANAKALSLAGIQINQKLVGGSIETNNGKLTGLLIDNAVDLVILILRCIKLNEIRLAGTGLKQMEGLVLQHLYSTLKFGSFPTLWSYFTG